MTDEYTIRCALIGSPLSLSLSPKIHTHFAEQFGMNFEYSLLDTPTELVEDTIRRFFAEGGRGLNITMPHKDFAYNFCKQHSIVSKTTRTVNTIWLNNDNNICGDNTDATGFIRDLVHNHNFDLKGKRVLVIGAGGVAKAIIPTLFVSGTDFLYIYNRSRYRAEKLVERYGNKRAALWDPETNHETFDLIINASSASLYGELPPVHANILAENAHCVDLVYSMESTIFCDWAQENGAARTWDGLGMLIEQAADAFEIWFKRRPETRDLYKQRYALLSSD